MFRDLWPVYFLIVLLASLIGYSGYVDYVYPCIKYDTVEKSGFYFIQVGGTNVPVFYTYHDCLQRKGIE